MDDTTAIQLLICIGRSGDPIDPSTREKLVALAPYDRLAMEHPNFWKAATVGWGLDDVVNLVRGLTLAEQFYEKGYCSVSSVIWTFDLVAESDPVVADELADWILPRTTNPWVPFGCRNHGARTADGYRRIHDRRRQDIEKAIAEDEQFHARAVAERTQQQQERENSARDRQTVKRVEFIRKLNSLPVIERLGLLADDTKYSVEFYPACLAGQATAEVLASLNPNVRNRLLRKLKGPRKGPWQRMKWRLLGTMKLDRWSRLPWDQEPWAI